MLCKSINIYNRLILQKMMHKSADESSLTQGAYKRLVLAVVDLHLIVDNPVGNKLSRSLSS